MKRPSYGHRMLGAVLVWLASGCARENDPPPQDRASGMGGVAPGPGAGPSGSGGSQVGPEVGGTGASPSGPDGGAGNGGSSTGVEPPPVGTVVVDGVSRMVSSVLCSGSDCTVGGYYILARTGADNEPGAFGVAVAFKSNPQDRDYSVQGRPQPICDDSSVPQWSSDEASLQAWVVDDEGQRVFFHSTAESSGTIAATAYGGPGHPESASFAGVSVFDAEGNEKTVSANLRCGD